MTPAQPCQDTWVPPTTLPDQITGGRVALDAWPRLHLFLDDRASIASAVGVPNADDAASNTTEPREAGR